MKLSIFIVMYSLPWLIACVRSSPARRVVALLNIFGFTGMGWFLALALSLK